MFPTVAETLGEVCSCGRELLKTIRVKNPVSFMYFMYCGQSGYFLNKSRTRTRWHRYIASQREYFEGDHGGGIQQ